MKTSNINCPSSLLLRHDVVSLCVMATVKSINETFNSTFIFTGNLTCTGSCYGLHDKQPGCVVKEETAALFMKVNCAKLFITAIIFTYNGWTKKSAPPPIIILVLVYICKCIYGKSHHLSVNCT